MNYWLSDLIIGGMFAVFAFIILLIVIGIKELIMNRFFSRKPEESIGS